MKLSKKIILNIFICLTITKYAASQHIWYVGLHLNPGMYQLYNKYDWSADPILIYPVKGKVNSVTIGLTTTYIWNKHFGASSGLLYNRCKQEFLAINNPSSPIDPNFYYGITNDFNYLKLPINIEYSTNNQAKHQFVSSFGITASYLLSYKEHFLAKFTGFYSESEINNKKQTAISPNNGNAIYNEFLYSRFLLGINSALSYRMKFDNGWIFQIGLRGEYDLTNAENRDAKNVTTNVKFWTYGLKRYGDGGPISNRPKTHNRSLGVFINASIPISIRL